MPLGTRGPAVAWGLTYPQAETPVMGVGVFPEPEHRVDAERLPTTLSETQEPFRVERSDASVHGNKYHCREQQQYLNFKEKM